MRDNSFDDLVLALQSAFLSAQASIRKKQAGRLRTTFAVDASGSVWFPVMSFIAPRKGSGMDSKGNAREMSSPSDLSGCGFAVPEIGRMSLLKLEFECGLGERKRFGSPSGFFLVVKKPGHPVAQDESRGRMEIVFRDSDRPCGEVRVNGELFAEMPPFDSDRELVSTASASKGVFRSLQNAWERLWPRTRFVVTPGQAERFREIVRNSAGDGAG